MSRYSTPIIFSIIFIFLGCSTKTTLPQAKIGKKTFKNEDILIIKGLEAQRTGKYNDASKIFQTLYEKSKKSDYIVQEAKESFLAKNYIQTLKLLNYAVKKYPKNEEIKKLLVGIYIKLKDYKKAEKVSLELLKKDRNQKTLSVLGDIYMLEKSYNLALKYYESAFKIDDSSQILLNMVNILYNFLDKKAEAVSYLETYIRIHDADERVYLVLLKIYGENKDINGLISTYKGLYFKFKRDKYAKKAIELMMYIREKNMAIKFLKKSNYEPDMLINIYTSMKNYKDAYKTAKQQYKLTQNSNYLGKMAIYEYEENRNNLTPKILKSVSQKFEQTLQDIQDPLYLNYYGYLLIDHDINIKKGIQLVKLALKKEPQSVFYLDSLAWGYYKLHKCTKAYKTMKKFIYDNSEPEVTMHYKKILKCLKDEK